MAGIHGLQHVQSLTGTNLTDNNAVRTHTQGVAYQVTNGNRTRALDIGRT